MSVHVSKCSYKPVECQWCKKNVGDGAVSSNSSSNLHACDQYSDMWFYYFRNISRMTVHWFLNTVITDVENKYPGKRQVR